MIPHHKSLLTDIALYRSSEPRITIHNWLRGRDVVEFVGLWEFLHNPDFKRIEFDTFRKNAGSKAYTFSIKEWNETLKGIGVVSKSGCYGCDILTLCFGANHTRAAIIQWDYGISYRDGTSNEVLCGG